MLSQRPRILVSVMILGALVTMTAGCLSKPAGKYSGASRSSGGFYGGDRPPGRTPANLDQIPDAVPRSLPRSQTGNKPYKALGKSYRPLKSAKGYRAKGVASWYGKKFHGRRTSSGEPYDMFAMTAAHPTLPLPSFVRVTSLENGRSVVVKVNDRGPFLHNRLIDLSYAAAHRLDITRSGTGRVEVMAIDPAESNASVDETQSDDSGPTVFTGTAGSSLDVNQQIQPAPASTWGLQLGVFTLLDNAMGLRRWLRQRGYPVEPSSDMELASTTPPYRVISGPFTSQHEAEQARQQLQRITRATILLRSL